MSAVMNSVLRNINLKRSKRSSFSVFNIDRTKVKMKANGFKVTDEMIKRFKSIEKKKNTKIVIGLVLGLGTIFTLLNVFFF